MCIAIFKPAGKTITKETLKSCFQSNKDGCGFSYINTDNMDRKKIVIKKSLDFDTFYRQYERALGNNPESPFLIHFRIKTHGTVSKFNCHPFKIDDSHAFIHNGVIGGVGTDSVKSDTQLFNDKILKKLPKGWTKREEIKLLIEEMIAHSKVVVMNLDGDVQIYNEDKGNWFEGVWYSNMSYKVYKPQVYTPPKYQTNRTYPKSEGYWKKCDVCGIFHAPSVLNYFCDSDDFRKLCPKCTAKSRADLSILDSDKISMDIYELWSGVEASYEATSSYAG